MFTQKSFSILLIGLNLFILNLQSGCHSEPETGISANLDADMRKDVHSFANPDEVVVEHIDLDLKVDFDKKQLSGKATLTILNKNKSNFLILDTNNLNITHITLDDQKTKSLFKMGKYEKYLGQPLLVKILPQTKKVHIFYSTNSDAAALQWLAPGQTAGGKHPFLFTQSQAILARSWIPCQDSPGIRVTYSAKIKTAPGLMAVMSAENGKTKIPDGSYHFNMLQPIPAYLIALAVGDLEFRALGPRSGVFAEPAMLKKAAYEFAETEKMIETTEKLYGKYQWQRYDILVLPPSFPFGGMENPRLTFVTPTILAGDRSLVALIAHELAHSWSGNLVTNADWNDFWLNEGFTTYIEHRIMEELHDGEYAKMLASLSYRELELELQDLGPESRDTHLHLDLKGRDPDEGMNSIAYDKGHFFLRTLEMFFGREKWDVFLRKYFDNFAFQSITSKQFVDYLQQELIANNKILEEKLQIDNWIHGPGIPENISKVHSSEFQKVESQMQMWLNGAPAFTLKTHGWTTHHWLHFLHNLPDSLDNLKMAELDGVFNFTNNGNSEILCAWFLHAVSNQYIFAFPALEDFLTSIGRRKFLSPLYTELAKTQMGLSLAKKIYKSARPGYHSIARSTIDEILNWKS